MPFYQNKYYVCAGTRFCLALGIVDTQIDSASSNPDEINVTDSEKLKYLIESNRC